VSIFLAILALAVLVLVHEAGHFFAALATRMRPRRFYIGFPPAVAKVKHKGIEYGVGAIPLGGYVKIPGMFRPGTRDLDLYFRPALEEDESLIEPVGTLRQSLEQEDHDRTKADLELLRERLASARLSPTATRFSKRGLEELDDALSPDAYWRQPTWKRLVVIAAGPVTNILVAMLIFAALYMLNTYRLGFNVAANAKTGALTTRVEGVLSDSPAARAGLEKGDVVVTINGEKVNGTTLIKHIGSSGGHPITLTVRRHGELQRLRTVEPMNLADSPSGALGESLGLTWRITRDIFVKGLGRLFVGEGRKQISSPVGIVQGSSDAYKQGAADFLFVVALISLSLGVLNLLPLLPLDGGHLVFSLIERVRGRPVPREIYERVSGIGIAFVLLLFVLGLSNDVQRL
jgi:regulator of sigma E protease